VVVRRVGVSGRPPRDPVGGADPDHEGRACGAAGPEDIAAVLATIDATSAVIASRGSHQDDAGPDRHEPGQH
jgi:hypothetical protein